MARQSQKNCYCTTICNCHFGKCIIFTYHKRYTNIKPLFNTLLDNLANMIAVNLEHIED